MDLPQFQRAQLNNTAVIEDLLTKYILRYDKYNL